MGTVLHVACGCCAAAVVTVCDEVICEDAEDVTAASPVM